MLNLAEELSYVSIACNLIDVSRDTFLLLQEPANEGAVEALIDENSRSPNLKIRVDPVIEKTVQDHAIDYPAHGQLYAPWFRKSISISTAE